MRTAKWCGRNAVMYHRDPDAERTENDTGRRHNKMQHFFTEQFDNRRKIEKWWQATRQQIIERQSTSRLYSVQIKKYQYNVNTRFQESSPKRWERNGLGNVEAWRGLRSGTSFLGRGKLHHIFFCKIERHKPPPVKSGKPGCVRRKATRPLIRSSTRFCWWVYQQYKLNGHIPTGKP